MKLKLVKTEDTTYFKKKIIFKIFNECDEYLGFVTCDSYLMTLQNKYNKNHDGTFIQIPDTYERLILLKNIDQELIGMFVCDEFEFEE